MELAGAGYHMRNIIRTYCETIIKGFSMAPIRAPLGTIGVLNNNAFQQYKFTSIVNDTPTSPIHLLLFSVMSSL
jgi:hypothetical protein